MTLLGIKADLSDVYDQLLKYPDIASLIDKEHVSKTPERVVDSLVDELFKGCWEKPEDVLNTTFSESIYDEIVYVADIQFVSICAHHLLPFFGKVHFGYLPDKKIVGLSKIPRLVNVFARRPQVQEKLTLDIVDSFTRLLEPKGCGVVIEAYHLCMMIRGVEQKTAFTKTTALRGCFKTAESTKQEFLHGIKKTSEQLWP